MKQPTPRAATPVPPADEFFIGWLPIPAGYARFLLPVTGILLASGLVVALLSTSAQQSPGSGVWDTRNRVSFAGIVYAFPYALIRVPADQPGKSPRTILLVEEGKFGAIDRVRAWDGLPVRVAGSLLHREDIWMLEMAAGEEGLTAFPLMPEAEQQLLRAAPQSAGAVTLRGEIIDSKCYLGAMKPGRRKTHKACAMLCISGGIPPLLVTRNADHQERLYLLARPDGGPISSDIIDFVGDPVELTGQLELHGDLQVLKLDVANIRRW